MKKVWIIYASSGAGHRRAAQAIYETFKEENIEADVSLLNSLDYTNPFLKNTYPATYLFLIRYMPWLWGFAYHFFDLFREGGVLFFLRRVFNMLNEKGLVKALKKEKPDVIILTHFFANEIISNMKRKGFKSRTVCVVTDFGLHSFWISRETDFYVVGSEETKADLAKRGISEDKIRVMGIPVRPVFREKKEKDALLEKLGLKKHLFTILIMSGGFGVGPVEELVKELGNLDAGLQLLVLCGDNRQLYQGISIFAKIARNPVYVYGFIENVDEMMIVSDLAITKSGGLTVSEAMAKCLPLIIVSPIPGQEYKNARFIVKTGAGWLARSLAGVTMLVNEMLKNPGVLAEKKDNCLKVSHPDASLRIAMLAMKNG
ncbi:MAG: hypothetical protein HY350_04865 [Candidatus Omnitrophica bacterium]|nr:hypothetical protein [Candidatus Omnitrophota bacterium]